MNKAQINKVAQLLGAKHIGQVKSEGGYFGALNTLEQVNSLKEKDNVKSK